MAKKTTPSNQAYKAQNRRDKNQVRRIARIELSLDRAQEKRELKGKPAPSRRFRFSKEEQQARRARKIERAREAIEAGNFVPDWLKELVAQTPPPPLSKPSKTTERINALVAAGAFDS